jgi:hypothetical protein
MIENAMTEIHSDSSGCCAFDLTGGVSREEILEDVLGRMTQQMLRD